MTDTLGLILEAFIREPEYCGELDTGLEDDHVWLTCMCGAAIRREVDERPNERGQTTSRKERSTVTKVPADAASSRRPARRRERRVRRFRSSRVIACPLRPFVSPKPIAAHAQLTRHLVTPTIRGPKF